MRRLPAHVVTAAEVSRIWSAPHPGASATPLGTNVRTGRRVHVDPVALDAAGLLPQRRVLVSGHSEALLRRWVIGAAGFGVRPVVLADDAVLVSTVAALGGQVITVGRDAATINILDDPKRREPLLETLLIAAGGQPLTAAEREVLGLALTRLRAQWDAPEAPLLWNVHAILDRLPGADRLTHILGSVVHHYGDVMDRPTSFTLDDSTPAICLVLAEQQVRDPVLRAILTAACWSHGMRAVTHTPVMPIACGVSGVAKAGALEPAVRLLTRDACVTLVADNVSDVPTGRLAIDMRVLAADMTLTIAISGAPRVVVSMTATPSEQAIARGEGLPAARTEPTTTDPLAELDPDSRAEQPGTDPVVAVVAGVAPDPPADPGQRDAQHDPAEAAGVAPEPPADPGQRDPTEAAGASRTATRVDPAPGETGQADPTTPTLPQVLQPTATDAPAVLTPDHPSLDDPTAADRAEAPTGQRRRGALIAAGLGAAGAFVIGAVTIASISTSEPAPVAGNASAGADSAIAADVPVRLNALLAAGAGLPLDTAAVLAAGAPFLPTVGGSVISASTVPEPGPTPAGQIVAAAAADPITAGGQIVAAGAKPRTSPVLRVRAVAWADAASWQQARDYVPSPRVYPAYSPADSAPGTAVVAPAQPAIPAPPPAQSTPTRSDGPAPAAVPAPNQPFNPQNPDSLP